MNDDGAAQQPARKKWWTLSRALDVLAVLVVLFVLYRIFIAPRYLNVSSAHPAPRVTYEMLDGRPFALAQQRGHVVFLDFWASWCEPCKLSLPLVERYARANPQVEVIAVDVGEPRAVVAEYARKHGMHNVALDPKTLSRGFFQIQGFPTMVVIDPQGRIRATWEGLNPAIQANMAHAAKTLSS